MKKSTKLLAISCAFLFASTVTYLNVTKETEKSAIEQQRTKHAKFLKESPFKESLTWDKKERKQKGLPPNRYYEQMHELTMNPSTGLMEDGSLSELRNSLIKKRATQRNPGNATNGWEERGPNNVGGRTRVIMFDPNDASNNTVYAGGVSGGLWKNTNISSSASQWARVTNVPGNLSVTSISVDPRNSNIWYVGTGEQYTAGDVVGNGVYVTTDGGNSWNALTIPAAGPDSFDYNASNLFLKGIYYVNDVLAWDNGTSTELFVGVGAHVYGDASSPSNWLGLQSAGIYRSTNGGTTWSRIESANLSHNFGGSDYYYLPNDFEVGADNKIWMGTIGSALGEGGGRVYSSTNGATWTEAAASPLTDSNRVELEPSASNPNKLYALTQGSTSPVHIYETTNAFGSITSKSLPNDADTGIPANDFTRGQAFYDLVIEADPANDNILYVGGIDLFKSTNGASSWSQLSHWYGGFGQSNNVHADQHSIAFGNNSSSEILFGNDGGVFYSGNSGSTISVRNNNYNVTQFVKAGIGPDGVGDTNGIFSAGAQDNGTQAFRDGNTGAGINSSEDLSDGDGFYTFVDKDGQYMIATYVFNVIYRFNLPWNGQGRIDGGATTLSNDQNTGDFVNPMDYDSDANRLLTNASTTSANAIKSFNVASNSNGSLTNAALTGKPTAFRASPFATNTWYVGMANGGLLRLTNVGNNSATWTTITTPFVGSVSSVRFGETANDVMVTIHNYGVTSIWYSSNAGSSWSNKEGNLPNIPVRDLLQNPLARNEAIVATQLGVWATDNFGDASPSWSQSFNGMSDVSVTSLDYWAVGGNDNNNKIIAATYGRGVFTGSFTSTSTPDTEAPSTPTALTTSNITENNIDLSWTASTDNIGVTGYDVYQNGSLQTTVSSTTYQAAGLTANTAYSFYVIAKDAAGNASSQSATTNATTAAPDTTAPSAPTSLVASGTTDTATNLTWAASTDNVAVTSYDVLNGTTVIGNTANTTFAVSGLAQDTSYSFSVKAKDAAGNVSNESNVAAVTTDATPINYCASQSTNVNDEFIGRVQLNTIDNTSGAQFYSDFTNISTTLTIGSQYTVSVTPTWTGTLYNEGYGVWIDFNRNGSFDDAGELVFSAAPSQTTPVSGSFTIPAGATIASTRMRVTMSYNATPTSCLAFQYGEVEDYTINIASAVPDTTAPVIALNGASTINLTVGDSYNELGATATDNIDGNLTSAIVTTGSVNTNTAGSYTVNYNVSDAAGNTATQVSRTVIVNEPAPDTIAPVITLTGNATIDLFVGDTYNELGATASDDVDGNLTSSIVITGSVNTNTVGTYTVNYNVSDAAGNAATQISRTVNVNEVPADTTAPVITLIGNTTIDLFVGDTYNEQGATASDNVDGNLTSSIVISGSVNTNVSGTYTLNYNVSDAAGNSATQVSRTVNVNETPTDAILHEGYFESGLDGWQDGGSDCARTSSSRSYEGSYSVRIRDNSGTGSSMTLSNVNLTPYAQVSINFFFYANSMENGEDFWVRFYNGSSWTTVQTYARGTDFNNATFYEATVVLNSANYNFASNSGFRFQNDASGNNDQIYIDQVTITGSSSSPAVNRIEELNSYNISSAEGVNNSLGDIIVYPVPARNVLNVNPAYNVKSTFKIIDVAGKTILRGKMNNNSINVSKLKAGIYFIELSDDEETFIEKFIKQ